MNASTLDTFPYSLRDCTLEEVASWLRDYPFPEYSWLAPIRRNEALEEVKGAFARWLGNPNDHLVLTVSNGGQSQGFLSASRQTWLSGVLAEEVWTVHFLLADANYAERRAHATALLTKCITHMGSGRSVGLFSYVPTDDLALVHAHQRAGFQLITTHLTFAFRTSDGQLYTSRVPRFGFREGKAEDLAHVLAFGSKAFAGDQYHLDTHISPAKADLVFERWLTASFTGHADLILIADRGGLPAACVTAKRDAALSRVTGRRVMRAELSVAAPSARGIYATFFSYAPDTYKDLADIVIGVIPITIKAPLRVAGSLRGVRRSEYVFHWWKQEDEHGVLVK